MKQYGKSIFLLSRPLGKTGRFFCIPAFFLLLVIPYIVLAIDLETPDAWKKKLLQTELELAKKGSVYTVLDLPSRQLTLKIKGLALKEFHFSDLSTSKKNAPSGAAHRLIKKHPPTPTIEKKIPPVDAADPTDNSEPEVSALLATESVFVSVADMPSRYRLYFEDGMMISIIPTLQECDCGRIEKGLRLVKETALSLSWEAGRLVVDRRFPDLSLTLSEEEAQALFWSLAEGSWLLVQSGQ
jgi:hypothetical protein